MTKANNPPSTVPDEVNKILDPMAMPMPVYVPGPVPGTSIVTYEWRMWMLTQLGASEEQANYALSLSCPDEAIRERASAAYADIVVNRATGATDPGAVDEPTAIM